MSKALVRMQNISIGRDGIRVLENIDLQLIRGEKVALVGASGAGKSTLISHLYQLLHTEAALCPQRQGLTESLSVYHNIYMGRLDRHPWWANAWNLLKPLKAEWQAATALAQKLELEGKMSQAVESLSGGERQRVGVARALFQQKPVFIGDETVSALDPRQANDILRLILDLHDTVIVALHNPELALGNFDRIIGLRSGSITLDKPAAELRAEELTGFYASD